MCPIPTNRAEGSGFGLSWPRATHLVTFFGYDVELNRNRGSMKRRLTVSRRRTWHRWRYAYG